jgi:parallel beta-helix repeat protein
MWKFGRFLCIGVSDKETRNHALRLVASLGIAGSGVLWGDLAIAQSVQTHQIMPAKQLMSQLTPTQLPQTAALIYVKPRLLGTGARMGDGSPSNPYTSITEALASQPTQGTVLQLSAGTYSRDTGEVFPIKVPEGITLRGEPSALGANVIVQGSGKLISPSFASQNVTILMSNGVRIEGLTVTNRESRGTAIWVESSKGVAIANSSLINSNREGIFITGNAEVTISDNLFKNNGANGISAVGSSTGEIRNNRFEDTGFGLAIGQRSRISVINNNIVKNVDGIVISNLASPTLRNNLITDSKRNGIVILKDRAGYPTPNLGIDGDLGQNVFKNNGDKDLNNNSGVPQVAVGNQLSSQKIAGQILFAGAAPTPPAPPAPSLTPQKAAPIVSEAPKSQIPIVRDRSEGVATTNEVLIDREPIAISPPPVTSLPQPLTAPPQSSPSLSIFAPSSPSPAAQTTTSGPMPIVIERSSAIAQAPDASMPTANAVAAIPPATSSTAVANVAANVAPIQVSLSNLVSLIPPAASEQAPYLVILLSTEPQILTLAQSAVPTAKVIPSRFGYVIMVQGYPDRDRAEVLRMIMRSATGLDARVMHQDNL